MVYNVTNNFTAMLIERVWAPTFSPQSQTVVSRIRKWFGSCRVALQAFWKLCKRDTKETQYIQNFNKLPTRIKPSQPVWVFISDHNKSPAMFYTSVQLALRDPAAVVWVPQLYAGGNCCLNMASEPIVNVLTEGVSRYARVILVGVGIGARIAVHVASQLEYPGRLAIVCVDGAIRGIPYASRGCVSKYKLDAALQRELDPDSPRTIGLVNVLHTSLASASLAFYASESKCEQAFVRVPNAQYFLVRRSSPMRIIARHQHELLCQWLRN